MEQGYCKLIGDNEPSSGDSRTVGSVALANITGKITWRWGPEGWNEIKHTTKTEYEIGRSKPPPKAILHVPYIGAVSASLAHKAKELLPKPLGPKRLRARSRTRPEKPY